MRPTLRTVAVLAVLALAACGGGSTGPSAPGTGDAPGTDDATPGLFGTYELVYVNGESPSTPWLVEQVSASVTARHYFTSGRYTLLSDSTYTFTVTGKLTMTNRSDLVIVQNAHGTFSFAPPEPGGASGTMTLHPSGGGTQTMYASTNAIHHVASLGSRPEEQVELVYAKP